MVHEPKKQFYKRFLYEPFPVESSLASQVSGERGGGRGQGLLLLIKYESGSLGRV
jgi:hypothetical protein